MQRAMSLSADFSLLGPMAQRGFGWDAFRLLATQAPMPVYAYGGAMDAASDEAHRAGAYGIAISLHEAGRQKGFGGMA
jgi:thiamine monophosphate synthase